MIVIATYNDTSILTNFLHSLKKTIDLDEKILIVCSCPNQTNMINFLNEIKSNNVFDFDFNISVTPYSGYDTGAFIWAYKEFYDEYYIFLQDSLIINNPNWLNTFKNFRDKSTLNTWCSFSVNDETAHTDFFIPKMGFTPNSLNGSVGVFGNMFQISKYGLDKINEKFNLSNFIPTDKVGSCAMERGWTYLCIYSDLNINSIDGEYSRNPNGYDDKLMTKIFNNRW
jgi:hypothetical protein